MRRDIDALEPLITPEATRTTDSSNAKAPQPVTSSSRMASLPGARLIAATQCLAAIISMGHSGIEEKGAFMSISFRGAATDAAQGVRYIGDAPARCRLGAGHQTLRGDAPQPARHQGHFLAYSRRSSADDDVADKIDASHTMPLAARPPPRTRQAAL